jgi:glycosyltransferase involved in cell wall biosynthesis
MKTKVLFLETHYLSKGLKRHHGVDYARVMNPAKYLAKHPDFDVEVRQDPIEGSEQKDWDGLTKYFDIIYCSYIDSPTGYVHLAMYSKKNKKPFIVDIDDNLWEVPKESPTYAHYHPGSEALHFVSCSIEDSPYISTTNMFLKRRIVDYCKKQHSAVKVLPNFIDLEYYDIKKVKPRQKDGKVNITFYGTNTHIIDMFESGFIKGLKRAVLEHPNVTFKTVGFFLPQLKTHLKKQYLFENGALDIFDWFKLWEKIMSETDITVAPLIPTDFNRSKSGIKYLEMSAAGKPGVYADIRQYQELVKDYPKKTGFLATTEYQWYKHLTELIEDEELRAEIGQNAYEFVRDNHSIENNINLYADYFKEVMKDYAGTANLKEAGIIIPGREIIA